MASKVPSFPPLDFEKFRTPYDSVADRLSEPDQQLVMVETGIDAASLISQIALRSAEVIPPSRSEEFHYWYAGQYRNPDTNRMRFGGKLVEHLPAARQVIKSLYDFGVGVASTHGTQLLGRQDWRSRSQLKALLSRRAQGSAGHVDEDDILVLWHGASHPGLSVKVDDEWFRVDDVPVGHALVWLGDAPTSDQVLGQPLCHSVVYRSMTRRVSLLHQHRVGIVTRYS